MRKTFKIGDKVRIVRLRKESIDHTADEFVARLKAKIESKAIGVIDSFYFPNGTRPNVTFDDLKATLWEDEIEKVELKYQLSIRMWVKQTKLYDTAEEAYKVGQKVAKPEDIAVEEVDA